MEAEITQAAPADAVEDAITNIVESFTVDDAPVSIRDAVAREIDMRIVPWGVAIQSIGGTEEFARGAFEGTDPTKVLLVGPDHERRLGLGHDGRPTLTRHPVGRGLSIEERDDGAYMTFRVARTQGGDEVLALIADDVARGVSVEVVPVPGGTEVQKRGGRRHSIHRRVVLDAVSAPVTRPAYGDHSTVLAVRSEVETETAGDNTVPESQEAPVAGAVITQIAPSADDIAAVIMSRMAAQPNPQADAIEAAINRIDALEERARASFQLPSTAPSHPDDFGRGHWLQLVLRAMTGESVNHQELQARVAADLITSDNMGVVPDAFLPELIGIIDPARPFLESTRKLNTPAAGIQLNVPVLTTRPTVGVQAEEKDELTSTATSITSTSFNPITIGGYGDISIQLLKRSDPSYLDLYIELLAEAYATLGDDKAVDALLAASGVHNGGTVNADDGLQFGDAWANASAVSKRLLPDTVWMSSSAVAAFIDAKADSTNAPLYGNLAAAFTASGGPGGTISGLRPVHVPALDDEAADIIVGPSRGFAWAEDGTYTLQVDVPAKAGRDVALVGMLWFAPLYPAAFTKYALGS